VRSSLGVSHPHNLTRRHVLAVAVALLTVLGVFAAPARAMITQADDQFTCVVYGGDVSEFMHAHHATVLRIVVPYRGASGALACARQAAAEGYRVYVSLPYDNGWRPSRVASYFRRALRDYAPIAWAVSVGNEQDLVQGAPPPHGRSLVCTVAHGRRSCRRSTAGEDYRAVWNAVEPVLARVAPRAIRVYGEISPFGFSFLENSFRAGRPHGAQAVAFHCYDVKNGGLRLVPQVAAWAGRQRLPLWCSEMSAAVVPSVHRWLRRDSLSRWNALLGWTKAHSPNLKMISYYRWPQIGAL
jgi:hypothetical protein